MLTNLHANPCGHSVSQRILGAHYTQIVGSPGSGAGSGFEEHAHLREFLAAERSWSAWPCAFLVVWWKPALLGAVTAPPLHSWTARCGALAARSHQPRRHAKLCRFGGARGAGGGEHLYRPRRHRAQPAGAPRPIVRRLLAELPPARRAQLGIRRHRGCEGHHRHQSTCDRGRRFDQRAARRRPHRRGDHRRPGPGHRSRHPRICRSAICRSCRWAAPTRCGWAISCSRSAIPMA